MKRTVTLLIALLLTAGLSSAQHKAVESVVATKSPLATVTLPVNVTAKDFMTKVYGVLDPSLDKAGNIAASQQVMNLTPEEDEYGLWLESADGYGVAYYGMTPDVSAHASFDNADRLATYGYFFIFPYGTGGRDAANAQQTAFSGTLLQDLLDMGLEMGVDELSDAIFEVAGDYDDSNIDIRLVEEHETADNSGRFILILSVDPSDAHLAAMNR